MTETRRAFWLIDAGFIVKNLNTVSPGFKIDYIKLRRAVLQRCGPIAEAHYVNSVPENMEAPQANLHKMLESPPPTGAGFKLSLHKLRKWPAKDIYCEQCMEKVSVTCPKPANHKLSVQQQKGVDAAIATLALAKLPQYDKLVLTSGDGDLAPAIKYVKEQGKEVVLVAFKQNVSNELHDLANQEFPIDNMADEVILR